jgi:flagellar protein FliS
MNYREQSLQGAGGVELIIALYDGAIRFLYRAVDCVEGDDIRGRREAVKKAVDIFMYLQARLRPDVGGRPAAALSDFYASMFTLTLEASAAASVPKLMDVIGFVRNVREAWVVAAKDTEAARVLPRELRTREEKIAAPVIPVASETEPVRATRWSA